MQAAEPTRSVAPQQLQRVPSDREDQAALLAQQQETIRAQQDLIRALQQTNNALQETNRLLQQGSGRERAASDYDEMQQIRARARIEGVLADTSADAPATAKATVWDAGGPSHQPPTVQGARTLMLPAPPSAPDEDRLLAHSKPGLGKGSGANWESAASVSDVTRMMSSTHLNAKNQLQEYCMDQRRMWPLPIYQIYQIEGMPHASGHSWSVQVRNSAGAVVVEAVGHGVTKKSAQMQAAESALEEIRARGC